MQGLFAALLFACALTVVFGDGELDWNVNVPHGESHQMVCNSTNKDFAFNMSRWDGKDPSWILPNLDKVGPSWVDTEEPANRKVSPDGWIFSFRKVEYDFFGAYHCMITTDDGEKYVFKHGLNLSANFGNIWERYRMGTIIGGAAAGVFLALVIIIFVVYKFRWVPPKEEPYNGSSNMTHVNKAFMEEDPVPGEAASAHPAAYVVPEPERPVSGNYDLTKC